MMSDSDAAVDLVVATVGRTRELARFLESLERQSFRDFRLIVVDQNADERLDAVLARHNQTMSILRLRSRPGLSRSRNVALEHVEAGLVAFPDDDCWYPPDLLRRVVDLLAVNQEWDGLSVRSVDSHGRPSNMRWDRDAGSIDRFNLWRRAISYSFFLRRSVVDAISGFDEDLGVGSGTRWRSGEEADYLLRVLDAGFSLRFEPSLYVHHESPQPRFGREASAKGYSFGVGNGRVLRIHGYPWWFAAYRVAQLIAGSLVFLATGRPATARFYFAMAIGRAQGWLQPHGPRRSRASE
jgi:glycosyltransferase involved in cell wall biosynthesis